MKLLTLGNYKTAKSKGYGFLTGILHLAPSKLSGRNVCPKATKGCIASCLNTAGHGRFSNVQQARIRKTKEYFENQDTFVEQLKSDIQQLVKKAKKLGLTPVVRINGTSDLPKLAQSMAKMFPDVQFYDYTKLPKAWKHELPNYRIIFSKSETNLLDCFAALENGLNVAVVFNTHRDKELPKTYLGYEVVDGDKHDLIFLHPKGTIIGLRAKGKAKSDKSGFVVNG